MHMYLEKKYKLKILRKKNKNHNTTSGSPDGGEMMVETVFQEDGSCSPTTYNESSSTGSARSTRRARKTTGSREARSPSDTGQAL